MVAKSNPFIISENEDTSELNLVNLVTNRIMPASVQHDILDIETCISRTGLADWTHALSWKQLLNNNPGIIHLLQYWRHHYQVTTADTALPYKLTN